jgi:hypothetical protein
MAISLTHTTVAVGTDAGNGEIAKTQWNENHTLTIGTGKLIGRTTAGTGAAEEISAGSGLTLSGGSLAVADNARTSALGYTIDGGGAVITTGIAGMGLIVPYACTIVDWTLLADTSGAIKIDVWRDTYANFPPTDADSLTNGNEPQITASGVKAQDTDLSNWTSVSIAAGDILYFNVDSCTSITKALLVFKVTKT